MSFNIIPTPPFAKELKQLAKKYPSIGYYFKRQRQIWRSRVTTYVQVIQTTIFLLAIYDKADIANITDKDLQERLKGLK